MRISVHNLDSFDRDRVPLVGWITFTKNKRGVLVRDDDALLTLDELCERLEKRGKGEWCVRVFVRGRWEDYYQTSKYSAALRRRMVAEGYKDGVSK